MASVFIVGFILFKEAFEQEICIYTIGLNFFLYDLRHTIGLKRILESVCAFADVLCAASDKRNMHAFSAGADTSRP